MICDTIGQLIQALSHHDPDTPIRVWYEAGCCYTDSLTVLENGEMDCDPR